MNENNPFLCYRRKHGLTQEQLARMIGVSFVTVSRWENGTRVPDPKFWPAIEAATGIVVSARDFRHADRQRVAA